MNRKQILSTYSEKEINKIKKNSYAITTYAGQNLEDIVLKLEKLRRQGKLNCFANFNGTKLYSIDVTMDSAFKECLGCTRKTWLKREKREFERIKIESEKRKKEAREKLPHWIEDGKKYIHPEKFLNWKKECIYSALGDYCGLEIENALKIMKMIEDGISFEEIKKKIKNDGHSGWTYSSMMCIVLDYAKRGPAFYNFMNRTTMIKEDKKYVSKIKELNKRLNQGQKYLQVTRDLKDYKAMNIAIANNLYDTNYSKGIIILKEDGNFEGIIDDENYIIGKIKENEIISFLKFDWECNPIHYCGIIQDVIFIGIQELYTIDGIVNNGEVYIKLSNNYDYNSFTEEIGLEYKANKHKEYFSDKNKNAYEFFVTNMESETQRSLMTIKESLEQRLVDALVYKVNSTGPVLKKKLTD